MKKPVLAALGLGAACVACCTLPLGLTLLGGSALVGGLAAVYDWSNGTLATAGVAALVTAAAIGRGLWYMRRNRRAACVTPAAGSYCATGPEASSCDCSPKS